MKNLLMRIKGVLYKIVGILWIVSPIGEDCCPVPVYVVDEQGKGDVIHRSIKIVRGKI